MVLNQEKLAKLQAASRTGGKGTPRRKMAPKPKGPGGEDSKLQAALKKLQVQPVSGIEEVNMFKEDGNVLHFNNAKVHGLPSSNIHAVYGNGVDKELTELVPGILNQLGPDSLASLRKLAESYQAMNAQHTASQASGAPVDASTTDDDVPDVVQNFDEAKDDADSTQVDKLD